MENFFSVSEDFLYLHIKASPGASKTALGEAREGRLKVKVAAAPADGKANDELRCFLAKTLGLAKKDVVLEKGEKSRLKTIRLPAAAKEKVEKLTET